MPLTADNAFTYFQFFWFSTCHRSSLRKMLFVGDVDDDDDDDPELFEDDDDDDSIIIQKKEMVAMNTIRK